MAPRIDRRILDEALILWMRRRKVLEESVLAEGINCRPLRRWASAGWIAGRYGIGASTLVQYRAEKLRRLERVTG